MAKLYFSYSSMNSGKSQKLLQANFNYIERGMETMLWTAAIANRDGYGVISSRSGSVAPAAVFDGKVNFLKTISNYMQSGEKLDAILIDEAQFLTAKQVSELANVVDKLHVPVMCYGLRTDFTGELFEGSSRLLAIADSIKEVKSICFCGSKATMVLRVDSKGVAISSGDKVCIGAEDLYVSVCRSHHSEGLAGEITLNKNKTPNETKFKITRPKQFKIFS
ncbi:TPA: thymidine kinase [Vibrio vulnificus]|uniref:Thymidine kinase n=1 Tax=Vibrio vulnificus TaxID=672 RepID=A0A8H9TFR2_VIBVL|nr:thymidine kinase [Vibrio vulnificus]HAS8541014.1 thymidine kinase [Vibrio vulnificus]